MTRPDVEEILLVPEDDDDDGKDNDGEDTEEDDSDDAVEEVGEVEMDKDDSDSFGGSGLVSCGEITEGVRSVTLIWLYEFFPSG